MRSFCLCYSIYLSKNIEDLIIFTSQVLCVSETHGRADQNHEVVDIDHFRAWRVERSGLAKAGGGLCLYYHDSLTAHCWTPMIPPDKQGAETERQWLLFDGVEKLALLHVYIACQTHQNDSFIEWNERLFSLITDETIKLRREGFSVIALGDFNTRVGQIPGLEANHPSTNRNTPMFLDFVKQANLVIINTLPVSHGLFSRFMGDSSENGVLLDYGLIDSDHVHNITSFIIDENARYDAASDHALLVATIVFSEKTKVSWCKKHSLRYDFNHESSFTTFQENLDKCVGSIPLSYFQTLSSAEMLPHLTSSLNESGKKSFGVKAKKARRGRKLSQPIIKAIKDKNIIAAEVAKAHSAHPPLAPELLAQLKDRLVAAKRDLKDMISDSKIKRIHYLRNKVLLHDPTRRKFWRFLSSQIKAAGTISGLYDASGSMVFEQQQIEDVVLEHFGKMFVGCKEPVYTDSVPDDQIALSISEIDSVLGSRSRSTPPDQYEGRVCRLFSAHELDATLGALPGGKASGYDDVPPEFLKHSSLKYRQYLLEFLNKIINDGKVPEALNQGKCILIYKVD